MIMLSLTDTEGEDCGKEGNIFKWKDFSPKRPAMGAERKGTYFILHGKAENTIIRNDGPCTRQSRVNVFRSEYQ